MIIYRTREWKGHGKQNYSWNEYHLEADKVIKFACHRSKFFDGKENNWEESAKKVASWLVDDLNMPEWLHKFIHR